MTDLVDARDSAATTDPGSASSIVGTARRRSTSPGSVLVPPLVVLALIIAVWYAIRSQLDPGRSFILPAPHTVFQRGFVDGTTIGQVSDVLVTALSDVIPFADFAPDITGESIFAENLLSLWVTMKVSLIGLLLATIIASALATLMSQTKVLERAFFPYLVIVQAVPVLAIVPLIGVVFGFGFSSRVIVCIIISFFPIAANTLLGLKSAERGQHELFTLHHASRMTRLRKLQIPAALPAFFTAMRISAGLSVVGAIVGDFFFSRGEKGLGSQLKTFASRPAETPELYAAVIMSSLLGIAVFLFFGWLGNRFIAKWSDLSV